MTRFGLFQDSFKNLSKLVEVFEGFSPIVVFWLFLGILFGFLGFFEGLAELLRDFSLFMTRFGLFQDSFKNLSKLVEVFEGFSPIVVFWLFLGILFGFLGFFEGLAELLRDFSLFMTGFGLFQDSFKASQSLVQKSVKTGWSFRGIFPHHRRYLAVLGDLFFDFWNPFRIMEGSWMIYRWLMIN